MGEYESALGAARKGVAIIVFLVTGLLHVSAASAAPGSVTLASITEAGVKGNAGSGARGSLSGDGTLLAFESSATNLAAGDTGSEADVYVKDRISGELILASSTGAGAGSNGWFSGHPSMARDARKVAFQSAASNLDPNDPDGSMDVFIKDLDSGAINVVDTPNRSCGGFAGNFDPSLSAAGTTVAFDSWDPIVSEEGGCDSDVFVSSASGAVVVRASQSQAGTVGNSDSSRPALSADGTRVAFISYATNLGPTDENGVWDVYVKDLTTGAVMLASSTATGTPGNGNSEGWVSISADGTKVAFPSRATNLSPADTTNGNDIYVKDLDTEAITLASSSSEGEVSNASQGLAPAISGDGRSVAFSSNATNLHPDKTGGEGQVFVKYLETGEIAVGSATADGVPAAGGGGEPSLSHDGATVSFTSSGADLDPSDTDDHGDAFFKSLGVGDDPDGDGITGEDDHCPEVAEDSDGVQDGDGCPDYNGRVSLKLSKHLKASGKVSSEDGICPSGAKVKIQKQNRKGKYKTVKTATAKASGAYSLKLADKPARYRAVTSQRGLKPQAVCLGAKSPATRHRHKKR